MFRHCDLNINWEHLQHLLYCVSVLSSLFSPLMCLNIHLSVKCTHPYAEDECVPFVLCKAYFEGCEGYK